MAIAPLEKSRANTGPNPAAETWKPAEVASSPEDVSEASDKDPLGARVADSAALRLMGLADKSRSRAEIRKMRADQNEAYASYADNIDATRQRELQERVQEAKTKLRGLGRSVLSRLKKTGGAMLDGTLAAGFVAVDSARGAKSGLERIDQYVSDRTAEAQQAALTKAGELASAGMDKTSELAGKAGAAMESGVKSATEWVGDKYDKTKDTVTDIKETSKDVIDAYRGRYLRARDKALTRRGERHRKWINKRSELAGKVRGGYERNKARIDVARGVGSVVVSHLYETKDKAKKAKDELSDARQL